MNVIMFVVGACLGLAMGTGLVTWARLSDGDQRIKKTCDEVTAELDRLESEVRRMQRKERRACQRNH